MEDYQIRQAAHRGLAEELAALPQCRLDALPSHERLSLVYDCCFHGHLSTLRVLLERGFSPNNDPTENRASPLDIAASYGYFEMVKLLREYGGCAVTGETDPGFESGSGDPQETMFLNMVGSNNTQAVRELLLQAPDLAYRSRLKHRESNGLHIAAENGHLEMAKLLLAAGCDVNADTSVDTTPLDEAQMANQPALIELIAAVGGLRH